MAKKSKKVVPPVWTEEQAKAEIRESYLKDSLKASDKGTTKADLEEQFFCKVGWTENLHAAHIFHDSFERHVASNPGIFLDDHLWDLAYKAMDAMGDLYQAIGQKL